MSLQVSASPHIRDNSSTQRIMLDVVLALLPTIAVSIFVFGTQSLLIILLTVVSAVFFEYLARRVMKRYNSISDLSAIVTGLLLALNLPPTVPFWIPIIGSFIAIVIVKQMFGGIGNNFVNPAMAARVVLMLSFPTYMTRWAIMAERLRQIGLGQAGVAVPGPDMIATATPLYLLQNPGTADLPSYFELFIGAKGGTIGEVSILALTIGAVYLLLRRVISWHIPVSYIATVGILIALGGQDPLYHILSGGLFLGAVFMATDYVTSPLTNKGKLIFGIGCGLITSLIRLYGGMTEGVSFSVLLMNILTPQIDRWTIPQPLGAIRQKKAKEEAASAKG